MHFTEWERLERGIWAVPFLAAWDALGPVHVLEARAPSWGFPAQLGSLPQIFRHMGHPAQQAAKELVKLQKCCLSCFCDKILSHHCWSQYVHEKYFGDLDVFHQTKISVGKLLEESAWWSTTCCCILLSEIQHDIMRQVSADSWEGNSQYQSWLFNFLLKLQRVSKTVPCLFMARGREHSGFG